MKVSLCLVVWNELRGCLIDVPRLPREEFDEIYAIDGGSTDGTREYLQSQGIPVYVQDKRGLNAAYVQANETSKSDAVVVFFPKGTVPVEDLKKFRPLLGQGNELIVASRQISGAYNEEDSHRFRPRKWAVWSLSVLAMTIWRRDGVWIRDVLHGIKGWKVSAFRRMKIRDSGLSIDLEMTIRSYKLRMKRVEFPTMENARSYGETRFRVWPTGKKLLAYLWYELWRRD